MSKEWKKLCTVGNPVEREIILSVLRSENIIVKEKGEALGKVYGFNSGPLAQVTLFVMESDLESARGALRTVDEISID